jgi:hypothetical protein
MTTVLENRPAGLDAREPGPSQWLRVPWRRRAVWAVLIAEIGLVLGFAAVYRPFDFEIYLWGGRAVRHGLELYLVQPQHNWFTYPPFAAAVFTPLAALPDVVARMAWELASMAALAWACLTTLRLAGRRVSRLEVAALTAGAFALEPVYHTLFLGQVNLFLMALVLWDLWRVATGRRAGLGIGISAAIKLTPAIFIVLLLTARRTRDAVVAMVTFAACTGLGFLADPSASRLYWTRLFDDTSRVNVPYISNQSFYSAAVRVLGGSGHVGAWCWLILAGLGAAGLLVATVLARHGDWLGAAAVTGVTGLVVSPVSWTHHWVWALPALVMLARGGPRARLAAAGACALFVVAPMWFTPHPGPGGTGQFGFHGLTTLAANCFLLAGLAFLAYAAVRACLPRPAAPAGLAVPSVPERIHLP